MSEMRTKSIFVLCIIYIIIIYVNNRFENTINYHQGQRILRNIKARIWEMYLLYSLVYLMTLSIQNMRLRLLGLLQNNELE
jgi:hypothetical protein